MRRIVFHVALLGVENSNPMEFKAHGPVINRVNYRSINPPRNVANFWPSIEFPPWLFRKKIIYIFKKKKYIKIFVKIQSKIP